ncbi:MAG: [acyl-carrier-protein] S-malonyltransferase [Gammaproteobacteria bacterium RIFCSPHIGHO2_12_FULL_41_20]|nr:MAG: [acyl-carrier-protein] S-malonyltransferase [Gammaproteobacteria bacterium RIFCSPHIGHO2_12_FULL_41_20]
MSQAIVFPGQGSQTVGMLQDIAVVYPEVERIFAQASAVLGYDLWQLVQQGPVEQLDKTIYAQPALLAAGYAVWQVLHKHSTIKPMWLAGHSLGEYTALVCAQALSFSDAIQLVAARGQYMQEAVPVGEGALAAIIGLDDQAVIALCHQAALAGEVLAPANFNSPGQIVIAGHTQAVERALPLAKERGAKIAKRLAVSVPSHCSLMQPAAKQLTHKLATISMQMPVIPVINNVDVQCYASVDAIRDGLVRQLFSPVRWLETIQYLAAAGVHQIIECGPGKVLTGLNKRIVDGMTCIHTADLSNVQEIVK